MKRLFSRLKALFRNEDGTATLEFVIAVPVMLIIFAGSFESGLFMTRSILLDRAVDMTMRELRLGHYPLPTKDLIKAEICNRTVVFSNCTTAITVELTRVNTANWTLPSSNVACVDRDEDIEPVTALQIGQQNDIMLVRICVIQDAIFPDMGLGQLLKVDDKGGYALVSVSAFVTEPL